MNAVSHHPGRIVAIGVVVAVALIALLPTSWAQAQTNTGGTPPPVVVTATSTTVSATATTTVTLAAGSSLVIPPGALPPDTTLTLAPLDLDTLPPPPESISDTGAPIFIAAAFTIDLSVGDVTLDEPATFSFTLTEDQIAALGGATPEMLFFDTTTNSWAPGGSTCTPPTSSTWNPATGTLSISVCHFSDWIVVGEQRADVDPGQVTTPSPADTGMGAATESGATDTMAIVLGLVALAGIVGVGTRFALARRQT